MIFGIFVLLAHVVTKRTGLPQKIDFTSLFVCVYRVFGENAVCYNSRSLYPVNCALCGSGGTGRHTICLLVSRALRTKSHLLHPPLLDEADSPLLCVFMSKDWRSEVDCVSSWTSIRICKDHA